MRVNRDYKQVIIVRQDLGMSQGKKVAQACHASVSAVLEAKKHNISDFNTWIRGGQKKVALKIRSEEDLNTLFHKAKDMRLPCSIIRDAGLTQLEPGTKTAVAIGPGKSSEIDKITGDLKLL